MVLVYPGAGMVDVVKRSELIICRERWTQIYILAGLCDITVKDPLSKCVTNRHASTAVALAIYQSEMNKAQEEIKAMLKYRAPVKVIFAPVTGMNLAVYNKRQNNQMDEVSQRQLNESIAVVNSTIINRNTLLGLATPWTHSVIHRRTRTSFSNLYHKLSGDGCHLSPPVLTHWAETLQDATYRNTQT